MFHSVEALCGQESAKIDKRSEDEGSLREVTVTLTNLDHWEKFNEHTTEMIVTKPGRNLFPKIEYNVSGLDPEAQYAFYIQIVRVDEFRYKFNEGKWSPTVQAEPLLPGTERFVPHQDGSWAPGAMWMKSPVSFDRLKLTNDPQNKTASFVPLSSMHKYQPILHIYKASTGDTAVSSSSHRNFAFPETHFIAVTAYQNYKITELKKDLNKYAKGCRKRQSTSPEDSVYIGKTPAKHTKAVFGPPQIVHISCCNPLAMNPYFLFPQPQI